MDEFEQRLLVTLQAVSAGELSPQDALQELARAVLQPLFVHGQIEAAAALSGRLAHDLNNHLTGVVGCSDVIAQRPDSPDVADLAQQISASAEGALRLAELLGHIGRMRRGKELEGSFDAVSVCKAALRVASDTLPANVVINGVWPGEDLRVDCGPGRLGRVVMHLLLLPAQSVKGPAQFWLEVRGGAAVDGSQFVEVSLKGLEVGATAGWARHPDMAVLLERGAQIEPGDTSFSIRLPRRTGALDKIEQTASSGPLRVLVVEDEPGVQQFLATVLRRRGCQVFVVNDGLSAMELASSEDAEFELLITDLNLARQSGLQLWQQLRPRIGACVIMTGQGSDDALEQQVKQAQAVLLTKPFSPNEVSVVLQAVRSKLR